MREEVKGFMKMNGKKIRKEQVKILRGDRLLPVTTASAITATT